GQVSSVAENALQQRTGRADDLHDDAHPGSVRGLAPGTTSSSSTVGYNDGAAQRIGRRRCVYRTSCSISTTDSFVFSGCGCVLTTRQPCLPNSFRALSPVPRTLTGTYLYSKSCAIGVLPGVEGTPASRQAGANANVEAVTVVVPPYSIPISYRA